MRRYGSGLGLARIRGVVIAVGLAVACGGALESEPDESARLLVADAPVAVSGGLVQGIEASRNPDVLVFKGIPFAAPPVGELRWRPPERVVAWDGVRDASQSGAICVQAGGQDVPQSEDCLFLNVWAPTDASQPRPVLFWIHGGGYTGGSGSTAIYDGTWLAAEGSVVVTINYRLNVFGFMAHPALSAESAHGASGNYGLLDMVAGLEWVRENISAFGGDPDRVTIFGESAGAGAVMSVMVMPQSEGLFHRAIAQSNWIHGWDRPLTGETSGFAPAESQGVGVAMALGAESPDSGTGLAVMREASAEAVLAAANDGAGSPFLRAGYVWAPNVDGWSVPDDPLAMYASGRQQDVPLIVGMNGNEGSLMTQGLAVESVDDFVTHLDTVYPDLAGDLEVHYSVTSDTTRAGIDHLVHDMYFAGPVRAHARHQAALSSPVWLYHFTHVPPTAWGETLGAHHAAELVYVFGTLTTTDEPGERPLGLSPVGEFTETDFQLSDTMRAYWVQFAATGDPNGEGMPAWPSFDSESDQHLELGAEVVPGHALHVEGAALWDQLQAVRRGE